MHFNSICFLVATGAVLTAAYPPFLGERTTCSTPDGAGTCIDTSTCSGFSEAGYCPGASNIQCCIVKSCSTASGSGTCKNTASGCSGTFVSGACPGSSSIQCCVPGGGGGGGGGTDIPTLDISQPQSSSFWSCVASSGYKVVIRGYSQACGSGGAVDSNFIASYRAAKAAGVSRVDAYMFPCTGTQPTGVACKSPSTQLAEFTGAIRNNGLALGHLWFDVEPTSGACNAWNLGGSANLALAQQWTSLLRSSGYSWGVYGNGNQWTAMFPSRSSNIGSDLPLWAVQDDGVPGVGTTTTFMGGWTKAFAKQYNLGTTVCGGSVDLSSFSG